MTATILAFPVRPSRSQNDCIQYFRRIARARVSRQAIELLHGLNFCLAANGSIDLAESEIISHLLTVEQDRRHL